VRSFAPDLLAVCDLPTHKRESWMVLAEGKGLDLCLEVCVRGRRRKDRLDNQKRYARLGIHEYFMLDVGYHILRGYRLPSADARTYRRIVSSKGRLHSEVLRLDIGYRHEVLSIHTGNARLLTPEEESDELAELVKEAEQRADAEQQRADAEQQRADAEQQRASEARALLTATLLDVIQLRGLVPSDDVRARIESCQDVGLLARWRQRALIAATVEAIFLDEPR
jgi:hypothetical protein